MWSQFLLCLLVGFVYASSNPAWKENTEYIYEVRGRTLTITNLRQVTNECVGIFFKAHLNVQSRSDNKLIATLKNVRYGEIHTHLPHVWRTVIPDSEIHYKDVKMSEKPFMIEMYNGVVRNLYVSKGVWNWEANIIKSIVSQFQLDTKGENVIQSHENTRFENSNDLAVYKTMEDTITGVSETLYEIHPLPEYILQSRPELALRYNSETDGKVFEIVKSKNFSRSQERPAYHFGFSDMKDFEPTGNRVGDFFSRSAVSRAIATGSLNRYTIHNAYTIDEIVMSTLDSKQKGSVMSMVNVTLVSFQPKQVENTDFPNATPLGNLVYKYDNPYSNLNDARQGKHSDEASSEERKYHNEDDRDDSSSVSNENYWQQDESRLSDPPEVPLLPLTVGFDGKSFKHDHDIVQTVQKIAQQIGRDIQHPNEIPARHTLEKFLVLTTYTKIMNEKEMQEVAKFLYSKERGEKRASWVTYRDAVAESGTGPALLTIQDWMISKKIQGEEAAQIIATISHATRQPTEEYMRSFYALVTKPEVMYESYLNNSAPLAFTELVRHVYVDRKGSHNRYPVHTFGSYRNDAFLKNEIIPYFTKQFNEAISRAETEKIHLYIRVLGNIAHPRILAAFEPYLEGKKQATQFQRFMMVVACDKLVKVYPKIAQSVMYKIYQNPEENEQLRVAAVYHLIRTNPSTEMLQRMASYTKIDPSEEVNSAVKSSIEAAARLYSPKDAALRESAEAAKAHLTKKTYGVQFSHLYLRNYVQKEMQAYYRQAIDTFGSENYYIPRSIGYSLQRRMGDIQDRLFDARAMVSSIDALVNIFEQQTENYHKEHQKKLKQEQENHEKWSDKYISKLLKSKFDRNEEVEGSLYVKIGCLQKLMSFNNHSIDHLPKMLEEIEKYFEDGKDFEYTKLMISNEKVISFPTVSGLPFIYTYDEPSMFRIEGKIQAKASPKLSSENLLHKLITAESELQVRVLISEKVQSQLGFIAPFNHQKYSGGYDKNVQIHAPVRAKFQFDFQNMQITTEFKSLEPEKDTRLFHYSTWPYTAKNDIAETQPIKHIIKNQKSYHMDTVFGEKETGIAFRVNVSSARPNWMTIPWLYKEIMEHNPMSLILSSWWDKEIEHNSMDVIIDAKRTSVNKVVARFGFNHNYQSQPQDTNESSSNDISQYSKITSDPSERQKEFMRRASANIRSVHSDVFDANVEFHGTQKIKYSFTGAMAKSNVDSKSRFLMFFRKFAENNHYEIALAAKSHVPNTNGLNFDYAMDFDPTSTTQIQVAFGKDYDNSSKIEAQIQFRKTEDRKRYLRELPMYHECKRQMESGNYQLAECARMTTRANKLDDVHVKIQYSDMDPRILNYTYNIYSAIRHVYYTNLYEDINSGTGKNEADLQVHFNPDFKYVNVSMKTKHMNSFIRNIDVNNWAEDVFVAHPVFHMKSRLMGRAFNYDNYRAYCVVDKTATRTFDNKTYPVDLGRDWTVMFRYNPRQQSSKVSDYNSDMNHENYAVLVRNTQSFQKEVKIVISSPRTEQKVSVFTFKSSSKVPKVYMFEDEIKYNNQHGKDFHDGYVQIYGLPNNEVKIEVQDAFYVIFDGVRVKLTMVNDKFRSSVQGLCGNFDGSSEIDFQSPRNCILRNPEELIASYTVMEPNSKSYQNEKIAELKERLEKSHCYRKKMSYANVISSIDYGSENQQVRKICTKHQTRYFAENGQICFSLHPMPVCQNSCQARDTISKNIAVHCVQKSTVSELWKKQIDKGASPDFSFKKQTKTIRIETPQRCTP